MDVQLAAATTRTDADGSPPPAPLTPLDATTTASGATAPSTAPLGGSSSPNGTAPQPGGKREDQSLSEAVSHLFGGGTKVDVTYVVTDHPNEIVTVFKNAATGEVLAQFPPEVMLKLAHFFQQLAGGLLDRTV